MPVLLFNDLFGLCPSFHGDFNEVAGRRQFAYGKVELGRGGHCFLQGKLLLHRTPPY